MRRMNSRTAVGVSFAALMSAPAMSLAQFGAATGEIRLNSTAHYQVGGVPTADGESATIPLAFSMSGLPTVVNASTPEANGSASITVQFEPSRLTISGAANANAWCDAPLESCGSQSETGLTLSFALPNGGAYTIAVADAFVQTTLSAHLVIRDSVGAEVLRIEDQFLQGLSGALAPGSYSIEAESVAVGEGEIPPHLGGYAAWSLSFEVSPFAPACPGDADADGVVAFGDVTSVLANFGAIGAISGPGDADGTGIVEFADVTAVLANFGAGCR